MAISTGNNSSARSTVTSTTFSWTHDSNSDFLVIGFVAGSTLSTEQVATITYAGSPMNLTTSITSSGVSVITYSAIFYLADPAQGANTVLVNLSTNALVKSGGGMSFSGIYKELPIAGSTVLNSSIALTVPSTRGAVAVSNGTANTAPPPTTGSSDTIISISTNSVVSFAMNHGMSYAFTDNNSTINVMRWGNLTGAVSHVGVAFAAADSGKGHNVVFIQ